jgi:tetratricopeptide (TPR) repeat protein
MLAADPNLQPIFSHRGEANMATGFFQRLIAVLEQHLPADDPTLARAYDRLALMYARHEQFEASAKLLERSLRANEKHYGPHSEHARLVRSNLAIQYRNMERDDLAEALMAESNVCQHLRAVEQYVRAQGARVHDIGTPYGGNCRTWVIFEDVVLDTEALSKRFDLPPCVTTHSHRGPHDGAGERGLVCDEHHDALMGVHPEDADDDVKVIR